MKKLITAAVALSMTLSAFAPCVFADDNMEKIVTDVKNRAGITDEYPDFSSDVSETDSMTTYYLGWEDEEDKKSISVTYNSDDVITSYSKYEFTDNTETDLSIPAISADEAKKAAQSFIDKLNPNNKGEFAVTDRNNMNSALSGDYSFGVEQFKNGAKIDNGYGRINVERNTGEVKSMYISYEHIDSFADISSVISADEAKAAYKAELGLELVYQSYSDDKKIVMFPAYVEKDTNKYINAVTGEVYEPKERNFRTYSKYAMSDASAENAMEAGGGATLSRAEREELDKIDGLISKADIEAQVRNNKLFDISSNMKLKNIDLNRNYYDKNSYWYSMSFESDDKYARVTADAKTGEIQSYFCNLTEVVYRNSVSEEAAEEEVDEETVKANADKILNELAKNKKDEYEFTNVRADIAIYTRLVNGIKVQGDTINIATDKDGKLDSYIMNYTTNTEFPEVKGILTNDNAADKMFEAIAYDITYIPEWNEDGTVTAEAVYKLSSNVRLNPFTGESVNYRNEHDTDIVSAYEYSDVENHWAKEQIKALASYGIGFDGGEFKPDEKITERDFMYILTKTFEPYMINDVVYKMDGKTEASSTEPVTRESAAVMMIKKMGADKFAQYEDIYVTPFKDVTKNKGYIALLSAMKVVKGDESGNFHPDNNMTRAEAACMIYNYLSK